MAIKTNLPPYLTPVNILDTDANEQIRKMGELARAMVTFDLICLEHGVFKWGVSEDRIDSEITRHRIGEQCWHEIKMGNHEIK